MDLVLFAIRFMVILLPVLIIEEGFKWFQKYMAKRGYEVTWAHFLLTILVIVTIVLYFKGYRW